MSDLLSFLSALPSGTALVVIGLACAVSRTGAAAVLGLAAVLLEWTLLDAEGLALTGAVSVLTVVALSACTGLAQRSDLEGPARFALSLPMAGLFLMALQLDHLGGVAGLLFLGALLERAMVPRGDADGRDPASGAPTGSARAWRAAGFISAVSAGLLGLGALGRWRDGGELAVEWVGTPFAGDAPSSLIFLGLLLPLAIPPGWGGAAQGLAAGPARNEVGGFLSAGLLRSLTLIVLLGRTFSGSDALLDVGLALAVLAPVLALIGRQTAAYSLGLLFYGVMGLLLGIAAIASDSAQGALGLSILGAALAGSGAALGLALSTHARAREPGLGERGLGHVFPLAFAFSLLAVLALMALPGTLLFEGRSSGLEAMSADGANAEALAFALMAGPLAVFAGLPLLRLTFFSPGLDGGHVEGRRPTISPAITLSFVITAGALLALGLVPSAASPLLPSGTPPADRLLTATQQLQILLGAALLARVVRRESRTGRA